MITKKDILKMVHHVSRRSRGIPDKRIIHPRRDWGIGLLLSFLVAVGGIAYSGYTYTQYNHIEDNIDEPVSGVVRYKESAVASALEHYRERAVQYQDRTTVFTVTPEIPVATSTEADAATSTVTTPEVVTLPTPEVQESSTEAPETPAEPDVPVEEVSEIPPAEPIGDDDLVAS